VSSHVAEVVRARDPEVAALLTALTADLDSEGYAPEESFGYSVEQLVERAVHLVGVRVNGVLAGVGGIEVQGDGVAELKRFYVLPQHRGAGVADAVITALLAHAGEHGVRTIRLETGDKQVAAIAFYRRHGFVEVPRFPPYVDSATSICMQRPTPTAF
jgi:putative acetyltransferase